MIRERTQITRTARLAKAKISLFGSCPHIDIQACSDHGFGVCWQTVECSFAAAEHTWALIMAAAKNIPQQINLQNGIWQYVCQEDCSADALGFMAMDVLQNRSQIMPKHLICKWSGGVLSRDEPVRRLMAAVAKSRATFFAENDIVSVHLRLPLQPRA